MINIWIDNTIFTLQRSGGISTLWHHLLPALKHALPDATFDLTQPADVCLSTYYRAAPEGVKSVVLVYDFIAERLPSIGANHPDALAKRQAIAHASAVIAISQWTAGDCLRYCGKSARVAYPGANHVQRVSPAGVDSFRRAHNIERPYVLLVGNRGQYKNAETVYEAWRLWQASTSYELIAIGGEPVQSWEPVRKLDLSTSDLNAAYTGAHCVVYPSLLEGFGLPVVEALRCGCPVICGSGGALAELVGQTTLQVEVCSPQQIAGALQWVTDPSVRINLIMAGYEQVKRFTWRAMADDVAQTIEGVCSE